jgi:hypothetical protein
MMGESVTISGVVAMRVISKVHLQSESPQHPVFDVLLDGKLVFVAVMKGGVADDGEPVISGIAAETLTRLAKAVERARGAELEVVALVAVADAEKQIESALYEAGAKCGVAIICADEDCLALTFDALGLEAI